MADSFKTGAFSQDAFAPAAFDFDEADPNALAGSFASGFTGAADLTLSAQVISLHGSHATPHRHDSRKRRFPAREEARRIARRAADEEILLAVL